MDTDRLAIENEKKHRTIGRITCTVHNESFKGMDVAATFVTLWTHFHILIFFYELRCLIFWKVKDSV